MKSRYAEYKDSGIEWIGEIPMHWEVKKVVNFFKAEKGRNSQIYTKEHCATIEGNFPVYSGQTENEGVMGMISSFEFDFEKNGCLLITTVGAKVMSLFFLKSKFSLSQNCMIAYPRIDNQLIVKFFYFHFGPIFSHYRSQISDHMQPSFRMEDFYQIKFLLPSLSEQEAIVSYLDEKTSQIDNLLSLTEKKIELLKEKRTALINHAVTKGLHPDAPMKDSGIEWIGEIPSHWEVQRLKFLAKVKMSSVDKHIYEDEIRVNVCHYTDAYYNEFIDSNTQLGLGTVTIEEFKKFKVYSGDVVMTKDSESPNDIGIPCYIKDVNEQTVCGYHLALIQSLGDVNGKFIYNQLKTNRIRSYFEVEANGITRFGLGKSSIELTEIILPPLSEQEAIVSYLDEKTSQIDSLIAIEQKRIDTLKEYRQSLISEVVTGKIKVAA